MGLLPEYRVLPSRRNGDVTLKTFWGTAEVFVGGFDQSTKYIRLMWRQALRRAPVKDVKAVLMLGLGIGAALPEIHNRYPRVKITVVEWDPVMIKLFRQFNPEVEVEILAGDALEIIPSLTRQFDLILIDLYKGNEPAPILYKPKLIREIAKLLAPQGVCLLNVFASEALITAFKQELKFVKAWKYRFNHLAMYQRQED